MLECPRCSSANIKKNGRTYYGKQNHKCKDCGRQFVINNDHTITWQTKALIDKSLMERISLRAISRIFEVSFTWLHHYATQRWKQAPDSLGVTAAVGQTIEKLQVFGIQLDEMWSFVQKKANKQWIWIAYEPVQRLVLAFHIGGRGVASAKRLWQKIPANLKNATFETDDWDAYKQIIPKHNHRVGKDFTYYIEGFNTTVRARVSRLVRKSLSFSKKLACHKLAIKWFFWKFNLENLAEPYL